MGEIWQNWPHYLTSCCSFGQWNLLSGMRRFWGSFHNTLNKITATPTRFSVALHDSMTVGDTLAGFLFKPNRARLVWREKPVIWRTENWSKNECVWKVFTVNTPRGNAEQDIPHFSIIGFLFTVSGKACQVSWFITTVNSYLFLPRWRHLRRTTRNSAETESFVEPSFLRLFRWLHRVTFRVDTSSK